MTPKISIIVPHYDRWDMLSELVATIPDVPEIEVLIVDDHSPAATSPSPSLTARVPIIRQVPGHRFAGAARNLGLERARGEWILFADSDDRFNTPELRGLLKTLPPQDVDVVYFKADSFREDGSQGRRHERINRLLDRARCDGLELLVQTYAPWAKLIRRDFIEGNAIRFDDVRFSNDVMFSAKVAVRSTRSEIRDTVIYSVREGHASLTSHPTLESISARLDVLIRYNVFLGASGHADLKVPAIGQLLSLALGHPLSTARLAIRARLQGTPVFLTWRRCVDIMKRNYGSSAT